MQGEERGGVWGRRPLIEGCAVQSGAETASKGNVLDFGWGPERVLSEPGQFRDGRATLLLTLLEGGWGEGQYFACECSRRWYYYHHIAGTPRAPFFFEMPVLRNEP